MTSASAGIRHALRSLYRRPAWALGVVATLAVGVGGVASVYAVAHRAVLRPVPGVSAGEDVVVLRLGSTAAHVTWSASHRDYMALSDALMPLRDLAAATPYDVHVWREREHAPVECGAGDAELLRRAGSRWRWWGCTQSWDEPSPSATTSWAYGPRSVRHAPGCYGTWRCSGSGSVPSAAPSVSLPRW